MKPQIFLVAPAGADAKNFVSDLQALAGRAPIAALLLPLGARDEADYAAFAAAVLPVAQAGNIAVLLEDRPELAKSLGADGVHMSGGIKALREAIRLLQPGMIVGAGNLHSRHDAMEKAEAGADYVFFGATDAQGTSEVAETAQWWAQTFQTPCVLMDGDSVDLEDVTAEFIAFSADVWSSSSRAAKRFDEFAAGLLVSP